jgi:predicted metal-dependent hydrolase
MAISSMFSVTGKVMPNYAKQKEWLKRYGASLGV